VALKQIAGPCNRWTLQRVVELIESEFQVSYHPNDLNRLLAKLGFSQQVPMPQAVEQERQLVQAWLEQDWPRIKKNSQRLNAEIVFWGEFGFSFQERLAPTWAPKGKRPVFQRGSYDRRALSTAVALTRSGKIYKCHLEGAIRSEQTIQTRQHLQRHISGKIILIWDRARIHPRKKVKQYLSQHPEIRIELLPAYAPELNPEEYCHGNVKQRLRNARPSNKPEKGFAMKRYPPTNLFLRFSQSLHTIAFHNDHLQRLEIQWLLHNRLG
jgi:transposase